MWQRLRALHQKSVPASTLHGIPPLPLQESSCMKSSYQECEKWYMTLEVLDFKHQIRFSFCPTITLPPNLDPVAAELQSCKWQHVQMGTKRLGRNQDLGGNKDCPNLDIYQDLHKREKHLCYGSYYILRCLCWNIKGSFMFFYVPHSVTYKPYKSL